MVEYNNILNLFSLILAFIILFIIMFGCKNCNYRYKERFENKENEDKKEIKNEDNNKNLSSFEKSVLEGLSSGSITTKDLTSLIKNEQFTETNLENLIDYVEKFKGGMKS